MGAHSIDTARARQLEGGWNAWADEISGSITGLRAEIASLELGSAGPTAPDHLADAAGSLAVVAAFLGEVRAAAAAADGFVGQSPLDIAVMMDRARTVASAGAPQHVRDAGAFASDRADRFHQWFGQTVGRRIEDGDVDRSVVDTLARYQHSAAFASGLFSVVSPDEIGRTIAAMSDALYDPTYGGPVDAEAATMYRDFVTALGVTLATHSSATGPYAPPRDLADRWVEFITRSHEDGGSPAAAGVAQLLFTAGGNHAGFGEAFLAEVASRVYEYERSFDGAAVWRPRVDYGNGVYAGVYDFTFTGSGDDVRAYPTWAYDPLAGLLAAMERTPGAAQTFFAAGNDASDPGAMNERIEYLVRDRIWPTDDGQGFGEAIAAATTVFRNDDATGELSATLASQTLAVIGGASGTGDSGWADPGWHLPLGMQDGVAKIVVSYMPDVYTVAESKEGSAPGGDADWVLGGDGAPFGLRVSRDHLSNVLRDLGRGDDKAAIEFVIAGALHYGHVQTDDFLADAVAGNPGMPLTIGSLDDYDYPGTDQSIVALLEDQASSFGKTMSFIIEDGFLGGDEAEAHDREVREALSKGFAAATQFIPTPAGQLAGGLTSIGLDQLGDALGRQPDGLTGAWAQGADEGIRDSMRFQTFDVLLANGFLGPDDPTNGIPAAALLTDSRGNVSINPALYDGVAGDEPGLDEFNDWLNAIDPGDGPHAPASLVQQYVNAYASEFGSFGPS
jgi:hypothetical protein